MSTLILIFTIICRWLIYKKAGKEGWEAIIPFYCMYTKCKIAGKDKLFIAWLVLNIISWIPVIMLIPSFFEIVQAIVYRDTGMVTGAVVTMVIACLVSILLSIPILVLSILIEIGFGKAFNKSAGFIVGMILLPVVFYGIMAFDSGTVYDGENADIIITSEY